MKKYLGIRREDKNKWERRVPIIPEDLKELKDVHGIEAVVQPSQLRIYPDNTFTENGALIEENLDNVNTIFAVKEIPVELLAADKTYIFFSHTIKGQSYIWSPFKILSLTFNNVLDKSMYCPLPPIDMWKSIGPDDELFNCDKG